MSQVEKRFVYVLQSNRDPRPYVGITWNVSQRLDTHNRGGSVHTRPGRPWRLAATIEFPTEQRALDFERYLKSGSGRAFMKRHLLDCRKSPALNAPWTCLSDHKLRLPITPSVKV